MSSHSDVPSVGIGDRPVDDLPAVQQDAAWTPSAATVRARIEAWQREALFVALFGDLHECVAFIARADELLMWCHTLLTEEE